MDSAMHQYNGSKRYTNLLNAYAAHADMLQIHGPDYLDQLNDFIAVNTITNLRNVLLFDRETPLGIRFSQAKEFVSQRMIVTALQKTIKKIDDRKERLKVFLVLHKCIGSLYILFAVREFIINITK
jgi:hypothetical protein